MTTNPLLKEAITSVLAKKATTQTSLSLSISSPNNPDFIYKTNFLEDFTIVQDFFQNYMDDITTTLTLSPRDYSRLYENRTSLHAILTVSYVDNTSNHILAIPEPLTFQYRILLTDLQNLKLRNPDIDKMVEPTMQTTIRLIEPEMFDITQQEIYGTFKDTNMLGVLKHVAQVTGIRRLSIYPPDNVMTYDHLIIPPAPGKNFSGIFSWLQDTYGVYLKGLAAYFTGGTLYIYPPYETRPETSEYIHLYIGERGEQSGLNSYHSVDGDIVNIVAPGAGTVTDLSQGGAEKAGTGMIMMRSSQLLDGFTETTAHGTRFTQKGSVVVNYEGSKQIAEGRRNVKHAPQTTDNVFALTSRTIKYQAQLINLEWMRSVFGLLHPGHRLKYLFDESQTLGTKDGILEGVSYSYSKVAPIGDGKFGYITSSKLRVRVEPSDDE